MAANTETINIDTVDKDLWDKIVEAAEGGGSGAGLPEVTSADNGDLLGVVEGEWGKVDPPADTFTVTLTENDGNWTADKTIAEILAANAAGKQCVATAIIDDTTVFFPLVTTSQGLVQFAGTSYTESANATYVAGIIDGSADEWFLNSVEITNELPSVTSSDNGSLLGVSSGVWAKVAAPTELPAVTSADNGDLLGVSSGAWAKVSPSSLTGTFVVTMTYANEAWTADKTVAEIIAAYAAGKQCVAVGEFSGDSGIDVALRLMMCADAAETVMFSGCLSVNDPSILTLFGRHTDSDAWTLYTTTLTQLPPVTALNNGSLLGVANGAWAIVADNSPWEIAVALSQDGNGKAVVTLTGVTAQALYNALAAGRTIKLVHTGDSMTTVLLPEFAVTAYVTGSGAAYAFHAIIGDGSIYMASNLDDDNTVVLTEV